MRKRELVWEFVGVVFVIAVVITVVGVILPKQSAIGKLVTQLLLLLFVYELDMATTNFKVSNFH